MEQNSHDYFARLECKMERIPISSEAALRLVSELIFIWRLASEVQSPPGSKSEPVDKPPTLAELGFDKKRAAR